MRLTKLEGKVIALATGASGFVSAASVSLNEFDYHVRMQKARAAAQEAAMLCDMAMAERSAETAQSGRLQGKEEEEGEEDKHGRV